MKLTAAQINLMLKSGELIRDKNGKLAVNPDRSRTKDPEKVVEDGKTKDRALNRRKSSGVIFIENQLILAGIEYETEFIFARPRKYRADFHLIGKNILIEYEGVISEKSRHTGIKGYTEGCNKYNLAVSLGYKVFRYTAKNMTSVRELIDQINGNGKTIEV